MANKQRSFDICINNLIKALLIYIAKIKDKKENLKEIIIIFNQYI